MLDVFLDFRHGLLELHSDYLKHFAATGGQIEYFIGWFTTDVSGGDTLSWDLLARLSKLKISLALDVYGNKQNGESDRAE